MFERASAVMTLPAELAREISPGTRLLWTGRAGRGVRFRTGVFFLVPFSLFRSGGVIFAGGAALLAGARDWGAALFFVPFVVIGAYFTVLHFVVDAFRKWTSYALTGREPIIVLGDPLSRVRRIDLARARHVQPIARRSASGTVWFGPRLFGHGEPGELLGFGSPAPTFQYVANARDVFAKFWPSAGPARRLQILTRRAPERRNRGAA
jgi:hypothetical protein